MVWLAWMLLGLFLGIILGGAITALFIAIVHDVEMSRMNGE